MTIITVTDRERELMKTVARSAREIDALKREIEGWKQDQKENLQIQVDMQAEINELLYRLKVAEEAQRCECSMNEACRFARERDELKSQLAQCLEQNTALDKQLAECESREPVAWMTVKKLKGKDTLSEPFVAINPEYVKVHKEWEWQPLYLGVKNES